MLLRRGASMASKNPPGWLGAPAPGASSLKAANFAIETSHDGRNLAYRFARAIVTMRRLNQDPLPPPQPAPRGRIRTSRDIATPAHGGRRRI